MLRVTAVGLLAALALLLGSGTASAHARLEGSDPADGASLDTAPQRVSLTFSDAMTADFSTLTVVGPGDVHYETGAVSAQDTTISIGLLPLGAAGTYQIGYRVVSADGHPVSGSVSFTLTTAGPAASTPTPTGTPAPAATSVAPAAPSTAAAPATPEGGGMPVWPWIVGAVVLVGGGVAVALRLGR
ncbi:hypothetical protein BJF78_28720 [Pseudonocardia sp. CNS-139]|nr:hypothetical protein BJF78_28720 [Pseudonocardia sp. CNS-139]